jgi:hypothetical protein
MAGGPPSNTGSDIRFHDEISSGSLSQVEMYHQLMHDNKQLIYEIKIGIVAVIGTIIIVVCLIYIFIQCKRSSSNLLNTYSRNRRLFEKTTSKDCHESMENLLKTKTHITIGTKNEMEFFV